jgi:hypothetical protein
METSLWTWGGRYSPIATATTYGLMTVVMSAALIRAPSVAATPGLGSSPDTFPRPDDLP